MDVAGLLPLLLILVFFYLLILRPARKRQQETARLQSSLAVGQQILTTAGLYARVVAVQDDAVVLETAPGVTSRWAKGAVARVVTQAAGSAADDAAAQNESAHGSPRARGAGSDADSSTTAGGATALGAADATSPPSPATPSTPDSNRDQS